MRCWISVSVKGRRNGSKGNDSWRTNSWKIRYWKNGSTRSVAEKTVKKMKVDSPLVKLLGVEDLQQASYSDSSLFFHFSNSDIGFNALSGSYSKAYPSKEQKYIKKKKTDKKQIRYCQKCPPYKEKKHSFKIISSTMNFVLVLQTFTELLEQKFALFHLLYVDCQFLHYRKVAFLNHFV